MYTTLTQDGDYLVVAVVHYPSHHHVSGNWELGNRPDTLQFQHHIISTPGKPSFPNVYCNTHVTHACTMDICTMNRVPIFTQVISNDQSIYLSKL